MPGHVVFANEGHCIEIGCRWTGIVRSRLFRGQGRHNEGVARGIRVKGSPFTEVTREAGEPGVPTLQGYTRG